MAASELTNLSDLLDDAKCFALRACKAVGR